MKKFLITILAAFTLSGSYGQTEGYAFKYAQTITQQDLHDYLSILASDALEGRETGTRGQKMAAAFISSHFEDLGLTAPVPLCNTSSYYQPVDLYSSTPGETYMEVDGNRYENFEEVIYYGTNSTGIKVKTDVLFAGRGTEADFERIKPEGKAALVVVDDAQAARPVAELAERHGVQILLIATTSNKDKFSEMASQYERWLAGGKMTLHKPTTDKSNSGVFFVSPKVAQDIFERPLEHLEKIADTDQLTRVKPSKISYETTQLITTINTENVLGYLEGTDKKDELIVITAHYDHEGRIGDTIYNGADDDASGTSAVIELAEAFAKAKEDGVGPKRSILFMAVTGEEKGLLGSEYYTANPVFPLENTITNLNIDMIGRIDPKHKDNHNYIYLVGSDRLSSELHELSERVNKTFTGLELDYTYNDEDHPDRIYYRSDHWNFAKNNIPVIFYFNGVHKDYHKPTDTIEKINFEMLTKRTKLIFYTAWALANRAERPAVDQLQKQEALGN